MALPREPRQKMINVMYLVLTAILALNVSNEVISAFKVVNKSLETSNTNIAAANDNLFAFLKDQLAAKESQQKALIWAPLADRAKGYSDSMYNYLENLKKALYQAAEYRKKAPVEAGTDSVEDYRADNLDASTRMFETEGQGDILKARLEKYKADILGINKDIKGQFEYSFPVSTDPPQTGEGKKKDFTQEFFHMTPTIAAITILSKFENNVRNAENEVVTYCHNQIGKVAIHMDKTGVIVGANTSYVMPGQQVQITAGVGAYSSAAASTITFNGANENVIEGKAVHTITATGRGEQTVNINVTFHDENNILRTQPAVVKYTVGTPGGSAVMLDKMNVFYIGVDNPITISSGTGAEKTHPSITSGTLTSTNIPGKYLIKVSTIGKATINVEADGHTSSFDFRIKRIPDPVLKVGPSSGGRVQSVVFKNQQFCRADLENFDFDARFAVIGATVYFSGANFPSVAQANIKGGNLSEIADKLAKCIPGTSVTFDNVRVQGPDGTIRTITGPGFILY